MMRIEHDAWAAFNRWHAIAHRDFDCDDGQAEGLAYVAAYCTATPVNVYPSIEDVKNTLTRALCGSPEPQKLIQALADHLDTLRPAHARADTPSIESQP